MRLWSLHPRYLDRRGLVALWREGLLAQAVLRGETRGYRHHPQLDRFREHAAPIAAITAYLLEVCGEAARRDYAFDRRKLGRPRSVVVPIPVTRGQLAFEWSHLLAKAGMRDRAWRASLESVVRPTPHPLFSVVPGGVEPWERGVRAVERA